MTLVAYRAFDSVTAANLPINATHVFYYDDGHWSNEAAVKARCPHAEYVDITVFGKVGAGMCDSEVGDLTVPETVAWVEKSLAAKVFRPRVYADLDRWENQGLLKQLAPHGNSIRRAVANYDNVPTIPAWADAKQFSSTAKLDTWVCADDFFVNHAPTPAPGPVPPKPGGVARAEIQYDLGTNVWTVTGQAGINLVLGNAPIFRSHTVKFNEHTGTWS